ncbi:formimidoylglutamase [Flavobacteriaceae bacterium]|nr:formimidoylglutamase [Flavobacteriaceae bacterium]MDC0496907.1 formimidoylglutamase [Flavobacteriaceae bacterium]
MNYNFLSPVDDLILSHMNLNSSLILGNRINIFSDVSSPPDLANVDVAIIGVNEYRNGINSLDENFSLNEIRKKFYNLYPGNWSLNIADLGDLILGENVFDTYQAMQSIISVLLKNNIIPVIIGGTQDLTYANYRSYDYLEKTVNVVNIDSNFDLGDSSKPIKNNSFLGKIILDKPHNLFNYSVLGYQTYFNSQEEIDLMEKLYFEPYRLGELNNSIQNAEPILRDANIVTLDLKSIKSSELSSKQKFSPNGFDGKEICAISRYAGISNKVSSFGIYEYLPSIEDEATEMLIAQIMWYFIEGVSCRIVDNNFHKVEDFQKFIVLVDSQELVFLKSVKSSRWWVEIPFAQNSNNKLDDHSLLPCMHEDYLDASKGVIPERWFKAQKKNII